MSFEAWVSVIGGILLIIGVVFTFIYKMFRSGIIEEVNLTFDKVYKQIDTSNGETYEAHQKIRSDMTSLIEKKIEENEKKNRDLAIERRKNDSDQIANINLQVSEMKLDTAKQLALISTDLKIMSSNMATFSNNLVEHKGKLSSLEKEIDRKEDKK